MNRPLPLLVILLLPLLAITPFVFSGCSASGGSQSDISVPQAASRQLGVRGEQYDEVMARHSLATEPQASKTPSGSNATESPASPRAVSKADGKNILASDMPASVNPAPSFSFPTTSHPRPDAVAVVIGNQRYASRGLGLNDVDFAERDAELIRRYLIESLGYDPANIIYRVDAGSADLRTIFGSRESSRGLLHNYIRAGVSEVFVYYSGHGAPGQSGSSSYLVPVDAQIDYIANTGYDLDLFYAILAGLPARQIVVVLDSCFSGDSAAGPLFANIKPAMLRTASPVREVPGALVFASAAQDQVSTWDKEKGYSLFTYFFLKGLSGKADFDKNGKVTAGELERYLAIEVPYRAQRLANRRQTPVLKGDREVVLVEIAPR